MPRLSIDLDQTEHRQLKAMAALKGQTIKDYVLSRALVDMPDPESMTDEEALDTLKRLLTPRIAQVDSGETVTAAADDIKRDGRRRRKT